MERPSRSAERVGMAAILPDGSVCSEQQPAEGIVLSVQATTADEPLAFEHTEVEVITCLPTFEPAGDQLASVGKRQWFEPRPGHPRDEVLDAVADGLVQIDCVRSRVAPDDHARSRHPDGRAIKGHANDRAKVSRCGPTAIRAHPAQVGSASRSCGAVNRYRVRLAPSQNTKTINKRDRPQTMLGRARSRPVLVVARGMRPSRRDRNVRSQP